MAKCEYCGREMLTAKGCTMKYIVLGDAKSSKIIRRMRVGDEGWVEPGGRCSDCGAKFGGYHHFGCDIEKCPDCGGQMMACECLDKYDEATGFMYLTTTKEAAKNVQRENQEGV